jgi:hypothetical protein
MAMVGNTVMRRALWTTAAFNLGVALVAAFPSSALGRLAGLPAPVPALYRALLAYLIAIFGLAYAWLARQPQIDRPFVAFAALGKAGVFVLAFACWIGGQAPARIALLASGDLLFAAIFVWWLLAEGEDA